MNRSEWHSPTPKPLLAHLRLPALPEVALRVLQLMNNEHVQLHQLSDLISADAAFASEVLIIANSAAYSLRFPACSVVQAVAVLGANHLQGICLTVAVRSYLGKFLGNPLIRNLWRHNLACAAIAERIASAGFMDKDAAYTAGMLHDIGRLALAIIRPADYAALLHAHAGSAESILPAETDLFGFNHCQAGKHLVNRWKLPPEFDPVVSEHHDERCTDAWSMTELIKISCRMADTTGFPAFPGCEPTPFSELQNELPDRERKAFHWELAALSNYVTEKINILDPVNPAAPR
jgi:putative nucleotidyltransferase with HDIG domain